MQNLQDWNLFNPVNPGELCLEVTAARLMPAVTIKLDRAARSFT